MVLTASVTEAGVSCKAVIVLPPDSKSESPFLHPVIITLQISSSAQTSIDLTFIIVGLFQFD
ncbi:hypothetical protein VAEKB19_5090004 [Vibrio aestuarianus]|nr:hypothetical protein VAEKB19_5090004 [Vibrio aestuarianus]